MGCCRRQTGFFSCDQQSWGRQAQLLKDYFLSVMTCFLDFSDFVRCFCFCICRSDTSSPLCQFPSEGAVCLMVALLAEVFSSYQPTRPALLALSFGRILKLYGFLLVLTTHQIGYWRLFCFPEGGATTQVCGSSLSYRPCLFSEHIPVRAFCISHVHWGKNVGWRRKCICCAKYGG